MSANYMRLLCLMACCLSICLAYGPVRPIVNRYGRGRVIDVVKPVDTAEAQAAALTNAAGAAAASAKLDGANWYALNRYGWEQGRPLLSKPYGPLDKLYAAALPPRSFVAEIDPVFKKSNYGGLYGDKTITLNTGAKLAVSVA
ncbi:chorion protein S16 [Drosophila grimshawi]|uniref:Chorion protein S16 n=1 Tax=Drosophila grimshawi TaxID=7222 RepID=CH16_DROGR|nr:chorion protein S16 [Drosophila grimshawi]P24510.1 RecName: Full=Chorion protein S16; Flags: Precursor [Drosophila grimshawi]EDV96232.1 chorion protein 16 [Drosophila grimshawi]CAA37507.1 chorion protein s16 [Drosophila grimshawi]